MEPHGSPAAAPAAPPAASAARSDAMSGNENVAAALRELDTVADRPLAEQPDGFARVHAGLQRALADIDGA